MRFPFSRLENGCELTVLSLLPPPPDRRHLSAPAKILPFSVNRTA
jgi:hypothetical protein